MPTLEDNASLALGNGSLEAPVGSVVHHAQQVKDINLSLLLLREDVLWQFACTRDYGNPTYVAGKLACKLQPAMSLRGYSALNAKEFPLATAAAAQGCSL